MIPNQSGAVFGPTAGIARNMQTPPVLLDGGLGGLLGGESPDVSPLAQGGGDLNGSANTAHLMGQAGTAGSRGALPRTLAKSRNYCGVATPLTGIEQDGVNLWPIGTGPTIANATFPTIVTPAPDGSTAGVHALIENTSNSGHNLIDQWTTGSPPVFTVLTFSCYAKSIPGGAVRGFSINAQNEALTTQARADFDLVNGLVAFSQSAVGGTLIRAAIEWADAGFWKCTLVGQIASGHQYGRFLTYLVNPAAGAPGSAGSIGYTGDGVSGVYIWRLKETTIGL